MLNIAISYGSNGAFNWLTITPSIVTAIVAVIVAVISYQNWRVSRDKLKLDLYNRRFAIYVSMLDFLAKASEIEEKKSASFDTNREFESIALAFVKQSREARFLFFSGDKIQSSISAFADWGRRQSHIIEHEIAANSPLGVDNKSRHQAQEMRDRTENSIAFGANLVLAVENSLYPYLRFDNFGPRSGKTRLYWERLKDLKPFSR